MTHTLELKNVSVALEGNRIVEAVDLRLEKGVIGCLLGPSGCGKTTLLRAIAGFEPIWSGQIWLDSRLISNPTRQLPVEQRQIGMVFQDYALFPHLSVIDNIQFGIRHLGNAERRKRVEQLAEMLKIDDLLQAYPHRLSGGQQQRVAIARAMAPRPQVLLLDEPFASLDVELREQIAREIRQVLKQDGITAILVSHNQYEAFAMADEIGVMRAGELLQWNTAFNLYHKPACAYVADFVGEGRFLAGVVNADKSVQTELGSLVPDSEHGFPAGSQVAVLVRPDDVIHDEQGTAQAILVDKAFRGAEYIYTLSLPSGARILSLVPSHHQHQAGETLGIRLNMDHLVLFPRDQQQMIRQDIVGV
ncbi:MAG: ABC transporter ATP-binding protein [Pseudomonadales bacterium]|nr:ABC transporter ATP-binding protein [Pseudomonadales bacterium]